MKMLRRLSSALDIMARGNKRGGKRGGAKGRGGRAANDDGRDGHLEKADMTNDRFFSYYRTIIPDDEWDAFVESLRSHLPTTFRVAGSREVKTTLNATIRDVHVPALSNIVFEGQPIPPPVQIPWYPSGLAWQFNVPKRVLRRQPEFKKFHNFLVFETEVGNVSRQEAVSMLPPLFLDARPHHIVMDMCAAPGSKTAQLLEALHADGNYPEGLLLANDSDAKRTHLLIHQSARLPSPSLLVTNLDASNYPTVRVPVDTIRAHEARVNDLPSVNKDGKIKYAPLKFDRILCDVPCSGDGTIRKNMGIWKTWSPMDGNGLHGLQLRILQRAMNLLKDDAPGTTDPARIVYSTCSLNPVENEAVVAQALLANPEFELVDTSPVLSTSSSSSSTTTTATTTTTETVNPTASTTPSSSPSPTPSSCPTLPALLRRPGLTTWRVAAERTGSRTFESYEEFLASDLDDTIKAKMTRGYWPPEDEEVEKAYGADYEKGEKGEGKGKREKRGLNLERCMRVYPHLQDTGGFFVAVFERRRKPSAAVSPSTAAAASTATKRDLEDASTANDEPESKRARLAQSPSEGMDAAMDQDAEAMEAIEAEAVQDVIEDEYTNPAVDPATNDSTPGASDDAKVAKKVEQIKEIKAVKEVKEVKEKRESKKMLRNTSDGGNGNGTFRENPYTFLEADDPVLLTCLERLHISATTFPTHNVLVRNPAGAPARGLYLVNDLVRGVVQANNYERLRLTAAGTKVFAKQESGTAQTQNKDKEKDVVVTKEDPTENVEATSTTVATTTTDANTVTQGTEKSDAKEDTGMFRVLGEGLPVVLPFVDPAYVIQGDMATLRTLVESYYPLCAVFPEPFRSVIEARPTGSHIVQFPLGNLDGAILTHDLVLPIWKSNVSVTLMIDKKAKSALSLRLFGADITTAGKNAKAAKEKSEQEKAKAAAAAASSSSSTGAALALADAEDESGAVTPVAAESSEAVDADADADLEDSEMAVAAEEDAEDVPM